MHIDGDEQGGMRPRANSSDQRNRIPSKGVSRDEPLLLGHSSGRGCCPVFRVQSATGIDLNRRGTGEVSEFQARQIRNPAHVSKSHVTTEDLGKRRKHSLNLPTSQRRGISAPAQNRK